MMTNNKNRNKQFHKLIKAIAGKDKGALENFYLLFGKFIFTSAKSVTHSTQLADEVVDDILFKIWNHANTFPVLKNPLGWLYTVTVNCAKDRLKSEKTVSEIFDFPDSKNMEDTIMEKDMFFHDILFLNESERELMIYRFIEDLPFVTISAIMRKPLSTVTTTYYRALEKIKKNF